jgi:hypothetical protein
VAVAHSRVGHQDALLRRASSRRSPSGRAHRAAAWFRRPPGCRHAERPRRSGIGRRQRPALGFRMAVDGHIRQIGQKLGGAVLPLDLLEQFRRRVDEPCRIGVVAEFRVPMIASRKVRLVATPRIRNSRSARSMRLNGFLRRRCPGRDLFQQRIVETGDHRAGIGRAAVEPDAEAGGAAIGGDAAVVGNEVLLRDLRW